VHGIGDLMVGWVDLTSPVRRQTGRHGVRWHQRQLPRDAVTIRRGLPITTVTWTVADLINAYTDLSLAAQAVKDGLAEVDTSKLARLIRPSVARNLKMADPRAVVEKVITLAGAR
jgi:hypothetical protein